MYPARPARTRTPALRISHFPEPQDRRYARPPRDGRAHPRRPSNPPLDNRREPQGHTSRPTPPVALLEVVRLHQGCGRLDVRGRAEITPEAVPKYGLRPTTCSGARMPFTARDPRTRSHHLHPCHRCHRCRRPRRGLKMWRDRKIGKAVRSDRPAIERPWLCPWVPQSSLRDEPGRCRLRWTSRILVARIWHAGGLRASNVMNICSSDGTF